MDGLRHGKGKVQTPNVLSSSTAAKAVVGTKIPWGKPHAGSSPAPGTNPLALAPDAVEADCDQFPVQV